MAVVSLCRFYCTSCIRTWWSLLIVENICAYTTRKYILHELSLPQRHGLVCVPLTRSFSNVTPTAMNLYIVVTRWWQVVFCHQEMDRPPACGLYHPTDVQGAGRCQQQLSTTNDRTWLKIFVTGVCIVFIVYNYYQMGKGENSRLYISLTLVRIVPGNADGVLRYSIYLARGNAKMLSLVFCNKAPRGWKTKCDTATLKFVESDVSLDINCRKWRQNLIKFV